MSIDSHVRGDTRIVCLIGNPVAHSLSPQIHNHAFRTLNLPFIYIPLSVPSGSLYTAAFAMRSFSFAGANVTIPHKSDITRYCDSLSELSKITGTVNTLYFTDGILRGTTTDPEGFTRALAWMGKGTEGDHVVILGNGGTARTISIYLGLHKKIASLTIVGRNHLKVASLVSEIGAKTGYVARTCTFDDPRLGEVMEQCTLLVNCTSVGMHPCTEATPLSAKYLHKSTVVFDAIYNPVRTRLLQEAQDAGCAVQNGLRMLLYQGLASFRLWTGIEAPEDIFDISELESMVGSR